MFGLWLVVDIWGFIVYLKFKNVQPIFQQSQDEKLPSVLIWLLGAVSFIFAAIGLIAIVSPPNNWDSIADRPRRVVHWMRNRNVDRVIQLLTCHN